MQTFNCGFIPANRASAARASIEIETPALAWLFRHFASESRANA
jgi:hypothetical protein